MNIYIVLFEHLAEGRRLTFLFMLVQEEEVNIVTTHIEKPSTWPSRDATRWMHPAFFISSRAYLACYPIAFSAILFF